MVGGGWRWSVMAARVRNPHHPQWQTPASKGARPARPAGDSIPRSVRYAVLDRDEHRCQRCAWSIRDYDYSIQHRRRKGAGGSRRANFLANLVLLCGSATTKCHGWATANEGKVASAQGFVVSQQADPASIAVLRFALTDRAVWSLLTNDGWQLASAPAVVDTWSAASLAHFETTGEHLSAAVVAAIAEGGVHRGVPAV